MLICLVCKPSVGKSTFFKAATLAEVEIASYPFTTIKANHGVGYVKVDCIEKEFHTKCNPNKGFCINQNRFVPIDLMDVAGLVPGASEGKGLGNQFLNDLRDANAFIHIVDSSGTTDTEGKPTKDHDPCKDIIFLEDELNKWYYNILIKAWRTFARKAEMQDISFSEAIVKQFSGLKVTENQVKDVLLKAKLPEKPTNWSDEDLMTFSARLREVSKPMILAANKCDSEKSKENIEYIPGENHFKIQKELNPKQSEALNRIEEDVLNVYGGTGVQEILNKVVFDLLDYLAIFPASANKLGDSKGNILPDCFLLKNRDALEIITR